MKKLVLFLVLSSLFLPSFAQKVEVKNGKIIQKGEEIALIEREGCKAFSPTCEFYIYNLDGEILITIIGETLETPQGRGKEDIIERFLRFSFSGFEEVCETRNPSLLATKERDIARIVARLIKDGELDKAAVENFIKANGTPFTDRINSLNKNININIIR